jgi:hypothetical protein
MTSLDGFLSIVIMKNHIANAISFDTTWDKFGADVGRDVL